MKKTGKVLQYYFVLFLRSILPVFIFRYPFYVIIGVFFLDAIDVEFAAKRVLTKSRYQEIDKLMDNWWYIWALVYTYFYLGQYFIFLLILFCYRIMGAIIFYKKKDRRIFLIFPNFFENAFFLIFFCKYFSWNLLLQGKIIFISLSVVFLLKIVQEYWIHIVQKSIPEDVLKIYKHNWLPE